MASKPNRPKTRTNIYCQARRYYEEQTRTHPSPIVLPGDIPLPKHSYPGTYLLSAKLPYCRLFGYLLNASEARSNRAQEQHPYIAKTQGISERGGGTETIIIT